MKIILLKDDKNLGKKGTLTEAKDGYCRNFLIPRKIAVEATKENLIKWKLEQKEIMEIEKDNREKAEKFKKKLEESTMLIKAKAGDGKRLFGAITSKDIADEIKKNYNYEIDKRKIDLSSNIKEIGNYTVNVKLFKDISANLNIEIKPM